MKNIFFRQISHSIKEWICSTKWKLWNNNNINHKLTLYSIKWLSYHIIMKFNCSFSKFSSFWFQEHMAKHSGDKPYKCEVCPKQFNHKTDLRRHMCLHTGEKPFSCEVCGKGFIREDRMVKHADTHKKKPPPIIMN